MVSSGLEVKTLMVLNACSTGKECVTRYPLVDSVFVIYNVPALH